MADKRIHELATTTDKSGKFIAVDDAGLPEALKFSADSLIDKAFTDTLYVKLAGAETVAGIKTWSNQGVFNAGILVTANGIDVTGNSNFANSLGIGVAVPLTQLHVKSPNTPVATFERDSVNGVSLHLLNNDGGMYFGIDAGEDFGIGPALDVGSGSFLSILKTTGNVGIGVDTPTTLFEVGGNSKFNGPVGIATDPSVSQNFKCQGQSEQINAWFVHDYAPSNYSDFGSSVANRNLYLTGLEGVGSATNHTAITISARITGTYVAFCSLVAQGISTSNNNSRFAVQLRHGTGSTDYRTPFKCDSIGTIYFQTKNTTEDITIKHVQSATTVCVTGWDDSTTGYQIAIGTAFGGTNRWEFKGTTTYFYGSSSASLYIDAATTNAAIYLQADTTDDAVIYFRQNTTTKFIVGYDDTYDNFQIHSSTSFSSAPDFCIDPSGNVGIGQDASTTIRFQVEKSYTSLTVLALFEAQGNTANAVGMKINSGLDTPTTTACITLQAADGNGSLVGQHQWNTTSGYNIWNALSSAAYKKNIVAATVNATDKLKLAQPQKWNWAGRTPGEILENEASGEDLIEHFGFVIESIEAIIPEAVETLKDAVTGDERKAICTNMLIPYLAKAVKELSDRLDILEP